MRGLLRSSLCFPCPERLAYRVRQCLIMYFGDCAFEEAETRTRRSACRFKSVFDAARRS